MSLLMHLGLITRVVKFWEIDSGTAHVFEEKPQQLANFVAEKLEGLLA